MKEIHEECGVFGVFNNNDFDSAALTYAGLYALQHRGQESCGICSAYQGDLKFFKELGQVREVFTENILSQLEGHISIGHVRYGTKKTGNGVNSQPLVNQYKKGQLAIAHNGSLANFATLREEMEEEGASFHTNSDAEIMLQLLTRSHGRSLGGQTLQDCVATIMPRLSGAYSVLVMDNNSLLAFRDPHGFRPLCLGKIEDSWVITSESCALDTVGAEFIRDVEPGEIICIDQNGLHSLRTHCGKPTHLCVFEYIYFARSDSIIDDQSVYEARLEAGRILARSFPVDADMVIGVPDSGVDAALGYAQEAGLPYGRGLTINRYIGRTFINPGQARREAAVRIKINAMRAAVEGKRIIMVDDSIVRGTTSANIVRMLKDAGATQVHMRVSSPPFLHPCYFGTDIPEPSQLLANRHSVEEIREMIGADSLGYLPVEQVCKIPLKTSCGLCDACFTGNYPVPVPSDH